MKKRGQIWVETVTYTLIAFVLIGLVLGFAKPKIEGLRDKAVIEQSIEMMSNLDLTMIEVIQAGAGNKRLVEVALRKGDLQLDGVNDKILFELKGKYIYSEPGETITQGNLEIITEQSGKVGFVNITRNFDNYNLTYNGKDELKTISKAATPYKFLISNLGEDLNGKVIVDIQLT